MSLPVVSAVDETSSLSTGRRTVVLVIVGTCSDMVVTAQGTHTFDDVSSRIQVPYNVHAISEVSIQHPLNTRMKTDTTVQSQAWTDGSHTGLANRRPDET